MSFKLKSLAALATACACGFSLNAQDGSPDGEVVELGSFSVTASRMMMPLGNVGSSITVLDKQDIQRFEANLTSDVLRTISGIYLRNNGGPGTTAGITMRGLPVAPLVLIDGIEVNAPHSGTIYNFGNLPTSVVGSVEVLRGAQSALYGGNALTGVISIDTVEPEDGARRFTGGTSYGSHNTSSTYLSGVVDAGRLDVSLVGSYYISDGYSSQPVEFGPEWEDDDGQIVRMIHGKASYDLADWLRAKVVVHYRDSEADYDPGTPSPYSTPIEDNHSTGEQFLFKGGLEADLTDYWTASTAYSVNNLQDTNNNSYGFSEGEAEMRKIELLNDLSVVENYRILIGAEHEEAEDMLGGYEFETDSVFAENVYDVTEDFTVTLGGRYDDNDTFGEESTWRTSASYAIAGTGFRVKGSYGTGFDAPEISELFGAYGNPDLQAETGRNFDAGIEWTSEDTRWSVLLTYFHVKQDDKIEYLRSTFSYENVDWVSNGVEASLRAFLTDDTRVSVSYTYADADRERVADQLIMHSPSDVVTAILDQDLLDDRVKLRLVAQYVGDRETWDGPTDAFFTVDLAASYQISQNFEVWGRIDNLFDEEYQEIRGYNGQPQEFTAGVKFQF